jgi:hypothetical protein
MNLASLAFITYNMVLCMVLAGTLLPASHRWRRHQVCVHLENPIRSVLIYFRCFVLYFEFRLLFFT